MSNNDTTHNSWFSKVFSWGRNKNDPINESKMENDKSVNVKTAKSEFLKSMTSDSESESSQNVTIKLKSDKISETKVVDASDKTEKLIDKVSVDTSEKSPSFDQESLKSSAKSSSIGQESINSTEKSSSVNKTSVKSSAKEKPLNDKESVKSSAKSSLTDKNENSSFLNLNESKESSANDYIVDEKVLTGKLTIDKIDSVIREQKELNVGTVQMRLSVDSNTSSNRSTIVGSETSSVISDSESLTIDAYCRTDDESDSSFRSIDEDKNEKVDGKEKNKEFTVKTDISKGETAEDADRIDEKTSRIYENTSKLNANIPAVIELTSDESCEDLSGVALNAVFAKCDADELKLNLAPVYSTVIKRSPSVPEPDWSGSDQSGTFVSKSALTSLTYWDTKVQKLRRERRKRGSRSSWRSFKNWWEKELKAAHIVQDAPKAPVSPASIRGSRILSMVAEDQQDILLEQLQGQAGFDELRKYIKQGGDFCKELAQILNERSEAEAQFSKTLAKLSSKLVKFTREGSGTVNSIWQRIGVEMETQSQLHRNFSNSLNEEVVKPLRSLVESQHRIRKSVETAVDKSGKSLGEWRTAESKAKKCSFMSSREYEKLKEPLHIPDHRQRISASASQIPKSDKDSAKMETKRKKAEECVKKADVDYYTVCLRAERARLEWESAVIRGSHCFQVLEEERLKGLQDLSNSYLNGFQHIGPKLTEIHDRIKDPVSKADVSSDLETAVGLRLASLPNQEQILPDFYSEHLFLAMNQDRRKQSLLKLLQLIKQDLERERRGKYGVENLARALKQTPTFAAEDTQQNLTDKLHHMRSMLAYLEATKYKILTILSEVEGRQKPSHPLSEHIHVSRDRQGYQHSVLKVPPWVHKDVVELPDSEWLERGNGDGNSVQPDSDFDEFSSQGSEKEFESVIKVTEVSARNTDIASTRCKALYNYTANLYDELTLSPGDIINIHDKQPDGWWLGELNGTVGIFPATYVEEIK